MKLKKIIKDNVKLYVVMAIIIILGTIGITYSLIIGNFNAVAINTTADVIDAEISYDEGTNSDKITSNGNMLPIVDSLVTGPNVTDTRVLKAKFNVTGVDGNPENTIYDVAMYFDNLDCALRTEDLKWRLYKNESLLSEGSLSPTFDTINNNRLVLTNTQEDLTNSTDKYTFLLWISESCPGNLTECDSSMDQSDYLNKTLNASIKIELSTKSKKQLVRTTGREGSCNFIETEVPICNNLTYNGNSQILVNTAGNYTLTNFNGTDAGLYAVTARLNNGYKWTDGSTQDKVMTCSIDKYNVSVTTLDQNITYGSGLSGTLDNINVFELLDGHTATSVLLNTSIYGVGTGTITASNLVIEDVEGNDVTSNYNIYYNNVGKINIGCLNMAVMPSASNVIYNGEEQSGLTGGEYIDISGTLNATNIGDYSVNIVPKENYCWEDGSTDTKSLDWKIYGNVYVITLDSHEADNIGTSQIYSSADRKFLDEELYTEISTSDMLEMPTKTGYTFGGYYTGKNGTGTQMINSEGYATNNLFDAGYAESTTLYAYWIGKEYTVTYDYNNSRTYSTGEYMDTGYKVNWDEDFIINTTINVATSGVRYLIIGNYNGADKKALSIEITAANALRVYFGTGQVDKSQGTITFNEDINVVFKWNASTDTYSITAKGTSTNISFSGTYSMSGISVENLRIGAKDYRSVASPFKQITVKSLKIPKTYTYGQPYGDLLKPTSDAYSFDGWYNWTTEKEDFTISAEDNLFNFTTVAWNIMPGVTYTITMDSAEVTEGTATNFSTFIWDWTDNKDLAYTTTNFGDNISYTITCPSTADPTHNIVMLIYSGKSGATSGVATSYTGVQFGTNGTTQSVKYNADSIVSVAGDQLLMARYKDDVRPEISSVSSSTTYDQTNYVSFTATDLSSGVAYYNITTDASEPVSWIPVVSDVESSTETKQDYGASWARVFHHNNHSGDVYFSGASEALSSNTVDKYSVLGNLENYRNTNGQFEFLLEYPGIDGYNRWIQTDNPATTKIENVSGGAVVSGYKAVNISWGDYYWGGLSLSTKEQTFIDGNVGHSDWFFAIGAYSNWSGGMPGPINAVNNYSVASQVNLWTRIDDREVEPQTTITRRIGNITENGTYYVWVKDGNGNVSYKSVEVNKVDNEPPSMNVYVGKILYTDPEFSAWNNGVAIYNNAGNGLVTITRKQISGIPNSTGYGLEIVTSGYAGPGHGGFYFATQSAADKEFVTKIVAKIPVGYTINWSTNRLGENSYHGKEEEWLTSQEGTGDWEEYIFRVKCWPSGNYFDTTNFFYLTGGSTATTSSPVIWQVAYATVIDTTIDGKDYIITHGWDDASGVNAYGYTTTPSSPTTWTDIDTQYDFASNYSFTQNATYYSWFKDAAGNISYKDSVVSNLPVYTINSNYYYFYQYSEWILFDSRSNNVVAGDTFTPYNVTSPSGYRPANTYDYYNSSYVLMGTGKTVGKDALTINQNLNIHVHYVPDEYTVSYNANGGSGAPGSQTKYYGTTLTLSNTSPTRTGYTFLGWSTSSTATSATYQPGGSYTANSGATLYAVWKDNVAPTCTLIANSSGVSFSSRSDNVGVSSYGMSTSNSATYNGTGTLALSAGTKYGFVKDAAGNTGSCSVTIAATTYSDTTPSCTSSNISSPSSACVSGSTYISNNCSTGISYKGDTYKCQLSSNATSGTCHCTNSSGIDVGLSGTYNTVRCKTACTNQGYTGSYVYGYAFEYYASFGDLGSYYCTVGQGMVDTCNATNNGKYYRDCTSFTKYSGTITCRTYSCPSGYTSVNNSWCYAY